VWGGRGEGRTRPGLEFVWVGEKGKGKGNKGEGRTCPGLEFVWGGERGGKVELHLVELL
jgi:hypothetical protein